MGPPTRAKNGKKGVVGARFTLKKASNADSVNKAMIILAEVDRVLAETMVANEGDDCVSTLRHRMRQLDDLQYAVACSGLTPSTLCWSLHVMVANKKRSLVPRPQDVGGIRTKNLTLLGSNVPIGLRSWLQSKVMQLLGRSIYGVMPDVELDILAWMMKQPSNNNIESSLYEKMVTAIMNKLSLPLTDEEVLLQSFQTISLEDSSNLGELKVVDEVYRVLRETIVVKEGDDLVTTLLERVEQLEKVDYALACSRLVSHGLRKSLHAILADKMMSLVPCPRDDGGIRTKQLAAVGRVVPDGARLLLRDEVLHLLGPSIYTVMPDLDMDILARMMMMKPSPNNEKQELCLSTYEEMVTTIVHKLELPPNYVDLVLQSRLRMSLSEQEHFLMYIRN